MSTTTSFGSMDRMLALDRARAQLGQDVYDQAVATLGEDWVAKNVGTTQSAQAQPQVDGATCLAALVLWGMIGVMTVAGYRESGWSGAIQQFLLGFLIANVVSGVVRWVIAQLPQVFALAIQMAFWLGVGYLVTQAVSYILSGTGAYFQYLLGHFG